MSSGNVFELGVGFLQYFFALIAERPDFDVPVSWESTNQYFSSLNFGLDFVRRYIPDLSDFRVYFLTVSVLVPLFFTYLGLIFVNPLRVIIWYFMVMTGILFALVGASARIFNQITQESNIEFQVQEGAANILLIVGCGILFFCLVLYGARNKLLICCDDVAAKNESNKHMSLEDRMEDETKGIQWNPTISRFVTSGILFTLGASFVGVIDINGPEIPIQALARGLGWFFIALAGPILIYMIIGLFQGGREWQWKVAHFFEQHFLRLYLLSLSLIYIPVGSGLFQVFNCNDFACPAGTRLFDEGSQAPWNFTGDGVPNSNDLCVTCNIPSNQDYCPSNIRSTICAAPPQSRLETDLSIECGNITPFFWPAAFIVLFFFMLGIPYLFFKLIAASSTILENEFPLEVDDEGNFVICKWDQSVLLSNNVARFLYQPFQDNMRYTRLFILFQKLLIVFTAVFVIRIPNVNPTAFSIYCSLGIHFIVFIALAWYRPFIRDFEDYLAIIMQVALVIASVLSVLIFYRIDMPNALYITIIVLNFALPALALIAAIVLEWTGSKAHEEEAEKKRQEAIEAEVAKEKEQEDKNEQDQQAREAAERAAKEQREANERYQRELAQQIEQIAGAIEANEQRDALEALSGQDQNQNNVMSPVSGNGITEQPHDIEMNESSTSPKISPDMIQDNNNNDGSGGSPTNVNPLSGTAASNNKSYHSDGEDDEEYNPDWDKTNASMMNSTSPGGDNSLRRRDSTRAGEKAPGGRYDQDGFFIPDDESVDQRKRRRQAKMKRKRQEVERRLQARKEAQDLIVTNKRNTIDNKVDTIVKEQLNKTVMIGGIAYLIAFCFCLVGLLSPETSKVSSFDEISRTGRLNYELVGYSSWEDFVGSCCCVSLNDAQSNTVVEKWVCANERIKERIRKTKEPLPATVNVNVSSVSLDGYSVRGLCSPVFTSGCTPVVSDDKSKVGIRCSDKVTGVTGYAMEYLW